MVWVGFSEFGYQLGILILSDGILVFLFYELGILIFLIKSVEFLILCRYSAYRELAYYYGIYEYVYSELLVFWVSGIMNSVITSLTLSVVVCG